ncbi:MAG: vWA domain-containing protein, partial [Anaerolineae bacterium]
MTTLGAILSNNNSTPLAKLIVVTVLFVAIFALGPMGVTGQAQPPLPAFDIVILVDYSSSMADVDPPGYKKVADGIRTLYSCLSSADAPSGDWRMVGEIHFGGLRGATTSPGPLTPSTTDEPVVNPGPSYIDLSRAMQLAYAQLEAMGSFADGHKPVVFIITDDRLLPEEAEGERPVEPQTYLGEIEQSVSQLGHRGTTVFVLTVGPIVTNRAFLEEIATATGGATYPLNKIANNGICEQMLEALVNTPVVSEAIPQLGPINLGPQLVVGEVITASVQITATQVLTLPHPTLVVTPTKPGVSPIVQSMQPVGDTGVYHAQVGPFEMARDYQFTVWVPKGENRFGFSYPRLERSRTITLSPKQSFVAKVWVPSFSVLTTLMVLIGIIVIAARSFGKEANSLQRGGKEATEALRNSQTLDRDRKVQDAERFFEQFRQHVDIESRSPARGLRRVVRRAFPDTFELYESYEGVMLELYEKEPVRAFKQVSEDARARSSGILHAAFTPRVMREILEREASNGSSCKILECLYLLMTHLPSNDWWEFLRRTAERLPANDPTGQLGQAYVLLAEDNLDQTNVLDRVQRVLNLLSCPPISQWADQRNLESVFVLARDLLDNTRPSGDVPFTSTTLSSFSSRAGPLTLSLLMDKVKNWAERIVDRNVVNQNLKIALGNATLPPPLMAVGQLLAERFEHIYEHHQEPVAIKLTFDGVTRKSLAGIEWAFLIENKTSWSPVWDIEPKLAVCQLKATPTTVLECPSARFLLLKPFFPEEKDSGLALAPDMEEHLCVRATGYATRDDLEKALEQEGIKATSLNDDPTLVVVKRKTGKCKPYSLCQGLAVKIKIGYRSEAGKHSQESAEYGLDWQGAP